MLNRSYIYSFALCVGALPSLFSGVGSPPLLPRNPVAVVTNNSISMPPVVAGNGDGFMTTVPSSSSLQANFSANNGTSWSQPSAIYENAFLPMWVSGNQTGFMATWIGDDIGPANGSPFWSFSKDNGNTWSTAQLITTAPYLYSPSVVTSNSAGFMATWRNWSDNNAYATFTSNQGTTWSTPTNISNSGTVASAVHVAGSSAGFMATWKDNSGAAKAAFTTNNGATWTSTNTIISSGVLSEVWVGANSTGYMAAWTTGTEVYISYNIAGQTSWSSPIAIVIYLSGSVSSNISIAGSDTGFVVTWVNPSDGNIIATFSSDNGNSWIDIVTVTTNGNVASGLNFVGVSIVADRCMFAWLGSDGHTYTSFSTLGMVFAPSNVSGIQHKNNFGFAYEIFNTLQWHTSTSSDLIGYKIFRNNVLIATVSPETTTYQDHNQQANASTIYSIQAFNGAGTTSVPFQVQFANGLASPLAVG